MLMLESRCGEQFTLSQPYLTWALTLATVDGWRGGLGGDGWPIQADGEGVCAGRMPEGDARELARVLRRVLDGLPYTQRFARAMLRDLAEFADEGEFDVTLDHTDPSEEEEVMAAVYRQDKLLLLSGQGPGFLMLLPQARWLCVFWKAALNGWRPKGEVFERLADYCAGVPVGGEDAASLGRALEAALQAGYWFRPGKEEREAQAVVELARRGNFTIREARPLDSVRWAEETGEEIPF